MSSNRRNQASSSHQEIELDDMIPHQEAASDENSEKGDLGILPIENLYNAINRLNGIADLNGLAAASRFFNQAAQPTVLKDRLLVLNKHILEATSQFTIHSAHPNKDETALLATKLLAEHPSYVFGQVSEPLLHTITQDPVGRLCQGSPLQLALGAGDVWLVKALREQVFPKCPEGAEQAQALFEEQFHAQFPRYNNPITLESIQAEAPDLVFSEEEKAFFELESRYYDVRNIQQIIAVKQAMMAVVDAITADDCQNANPQDSTQACIDVLKLALAPKEDEIIQTGLHFPLFMLAMAADVYRAQYVAYQANQAGAWDRSNQWAEKWSVYSRLVLGLVEKHLTAVDGQSLKNGLGNDSNNLNKEKGPDRQDGIFIKGAKGQAPGSLALANDLGKTAFVTFIDSWVACLSADPKFFDFVNKKAGEAKGVAVACLSQGGWRRAARGPGNLMQNKNRHYSELLSSHPKRSQDIVEVTTHRRNA